MAWIVAVPSNEESWYSPWILKSSLSGGYKFSELQSCYLAADKQPIHIFEVTALDISSTGIRSLVKEGRSIGYLVPRKTAEFINSRGLYL